MITLRAADQRGHANHGWLDTYHTFSFADYYDPAQMGFRSLRVINEDHVAAGAGFPTHPHREMEIITYVIEGTIAHRDSMGNGSTVRPGEVQRMTAGTGVTHSEYNGSKSDPLHLLQIWILPGTPGLTPSYEQRAFAASDRQNKLCLLASQDGRDDSVTIHQDVSLYGALLGKGKTLTHSLGAERHAWLQLVSGKLRLNNGTELRAGDGARVSGEPLSISADEDAHFLLFDLA